MARYALVIGITKYDHLAPNLPKAATDAAAIAQILQAQGQYQVEPLPKRLIETENRWELATDKKLTGKNLGQALETFFLERATNQEALIYFAGHGFEVPGLGRKKKGYLATSDSTNDGRSAILLSDLNDLIRESSLSSLVLILDCCHAGSLLERTLLESTLTAFKEKQDYYLITACRSFERAREDEEHGIFTAAVLKGLRAENADSEGTITGDRLFDSVRQELSNSGQEPIRLGWGRSLAIVRYQLQNAEVFRKGVVDETCPYQGLRPFDKSTAKFFFGREQVIQLLLEKLERSAFVPIIGASGSGKSSVVRAGLIPELEKSGWAILNPIQPGIEPIAKLKTVLEQFFREKGELITFQQIYSRIKEGLYETIKHLQGEGRILLLIDQFEEVFTVCSSEEERYRFIELITGVDQVPDCRLAIVVTIRADFLEPCLNYGQLTKLIQAQAIYVSQLSGEELDRVISVPAMLQGYSLEQGLLSMIRRDVGQEKDCLPLLQFALTELWEQRDQNTHQLSITQYERLGDDQNNGVIGALNRYAEQLYYQFSPLEQEWTKQICLRLVRTGTTAKDTRQRQPKQKLSEFARDNNSQLLVDKVLQKLIDGRLLVAGGELEGEAWIDLAHEALMERWFRFVEWRQEGRELRRLIDRVEDALWEWSKNPQDENLMMGGLLTQVQDKWSDLEPFLESSARDFYHQSKSSAQQQTVALQLAREQDLALLKNKVDSAMSCLSQQPNEGLVRTIEAVGLSIDKLQGEVVGEVQSCLHEAVEAIRRYHPPYLFRGHEGLISSIAFSPNGEYIASAGHDGVIQLWNLQGEKIGEPFRGHEGPIETLAFSPNSDFITTGGWDRTIRFWNLQGQELCEPFRGHEHWVTSVAFSPDGQWIASGSFDETLRIWNLKGQLLVSPFHGHEGAILAVAVSPDGKRIVSSSSDTTVRLWDLQGQELCEPLRGHGHWVTSVAWSPNGQWIISGSRDKTLQLWSFEGKPVGLPFKNNSSSIEAVAFSPDSQHIISGNSDGMIQLWNLVGQLAGQSFQRGDWVWSVASSPDGLYIASGGEDGTLRLSKSANWQSWLQVACSLLLENSSIAELSEDVNSSAYELCKKHLLVEIKS